MTDEQINRIVKAILAINLPLWFMAACLYFLMLSSCSHK